jgi:predicted methyltransferase
MSKSKRGRALSLLRSALVLLAIFVCSSALVHAQQDWAERDKWQRPTEVLDALGVKPRSIVADVGAGEGYFTFHLAERVGPQGRVYAEDIREDVLAKIRSQAAKQGLHQVETILGTPSDPRLPDKALDAVLVVNAYHEMLEFDAMLQGMFRALKPGGLLAIIDAEDRLGESRKTYQSRHTLPKQFVRADTAQNGFRFLRELPGFSNPNRKRNYYFLLFEKPAGP